MSFITVKHNVEVAHRLFDLKGKCEQIHGHSMWIEMKLHGHVRNGYIVDPSFGLPLAFGDVKKLFRSYLDSNYDHRLLLNEKDPWAQLQHTGTQPKVLELLPGLQIVQGDPSTENIAKWVAEWSVKQFGMDVDVHVQETHVNGAGYSMKGNNGTRTKP